MICKICHKKFHWCSSCGYDRNADQETCSDECYEKAMGPALDELRKFLDSLNDEQREYVIQNMEHVDFQEDIEDLI